MIIRLAAQADAPALLRIYGQYMDTPVTFEYTLPTEEAFARRIADISGGYPYLVCEEDGRITGYAYAHRQAERAAYQWNAELSVYLDRACTSRGLGRQLYTALIELLKLQGIRTVYGCVTVPNEKSERLHESLGFRRIGTYRLAGFKAGAWHDVAWFEKPIAPYDQDPIPLLPFPAVPREETDAVLRRFSQPPCSLSTTKADGEMTIGLEI